MSKYSKQPCGIQLTEGNTDWLRDSVKLTTHLEVIVQSHTWLQTKQVCRLVENTAADREK